MNNDSWAGGPWRFNSGKTKTTMLVARPFRNLGFINKTADGSHGVLSFIADVARNLSVTYNKADNFVPQSPAIDLFLNQLPNTTGKTREYGLLAPDGGQQVCSALQPLLDQADQCPQW